MNLSVMTFHMIREGRIKKIIRVNLVLRTGWTPILSRCRRVPFAISEMGLTLINIII